MPKVKKIYISARDSKILTVPVKTKNRTPDPDVTSNVKIFHQRWGKSHRWWEITKGARALSKILNTILKLQ
jgi:hypothetical protein